MLNIDCDLLDIVIKESSFPEKEYWNRRILIAIKA